MGVSAEAPLQAARNVNATRVYFLGTSNIARALPTTVCFAAHC